MKILYFLTKIAIGGTEAVVRDLSLLASKQGHDVTIITFLEQDNHIVDEIKKNPITLLRFPSRNLLSLKNFIYLKKVIKENNYDIIHAHTEEAHFYLSFVSFIFRFPAPIVMTEHYFRYRNIRFNPFRRIMYQRYQRVICVSHHMQDFFHRYLNKIHKRCLTIQNGIPIRALSSTSNTAKKPIQVICNARLVKQKDLQTCINAFSKISSNMHLTITGNGTLYKKLDKLIIQLKLQHKVTLLGWRQDITRLLQTADIYIQSSKWEGFSIAVLEAMSHGLPLIVSNAPGLLEAVGDAAMIFPIGDSARLANCLDTLAKSPSLRQHLSYKSKNRVQEYSLDKMWEKYATVYEDVIKEHQSSLIKDRHESLISVR